MKIKTASFIKSAVAPGDYAETGLPEIAFVGRSNVGKSSLINKLLSRKALAKTSSTPGKTRLINFFLINDDLVFVDLPGYGYAKVSKQERAALGKMVDRYFSVRETLKAVVILQDIRRDQTEMDRAMIEMVRQYGIPVIIALTKADKFSRNGQAKRLKELKPVLARLERRPILFSSVSGAGVEELWKEICSLTGLEAEKNLTPVE